MADTLRGRVGKGGMRVYWERVREGEGEGRGGVRRRERGEGRRTT